MKKDSLVRHLSTSLPLIFIRFSCEKFLLVKDNLPTLNKLNSKLDSF